MNRYFLPLLLATLPLLAPSPAAAQESGSFLGRFGAQHSWASDGQRAWYQVQGPEGSAATAARGPAGAAVSHMTPNSTGSTAVSNQGDVYHTRSTNRFSRTLEAHPGVGAAWAGTNSRTGGSGSGVATPYGGRGQRTTGNGTQVDWGYIPGRGAGALVQQGDQVAFYGYQAQTGRVVVR